VFERGHFAGVEEMRTNERLFERVAPMGVNDIAMACQYKFEGVAKLDVPVTSFDGLADNTIDAGISHAYTSLVKVNLC
jgi:surfactin synthase thioesterase subunit